MSNSTTQIPQLTFAQEGMDSTANENFDAAWPSFHFARHPDSTGLTWYFFGKTYPKSDGTLVQVPGGSLALTASAVNYIIDTDGVLSKTTSMPSGWPAPLSGGVKAVYDVTCDADGATDWNDWRTDGGGATSTGGAAPFSDATALVKGSADATKLVRFEVDGLTTATTRVVTVPDKSGTMAMLDDLTSLVATTDAMIFKGVIDCSANPNYPAGDRGDTYRVSVAGKIGGGSGVNVEAGDLLVCLTDGTVTGTQAAVGASWTIAQTNLDGAVIGPASVTDSHFAQFDGTTGKLLKGGLALDTDTALAANSDTRVPSQKAVKAAIAAAITAQPFDVHTFYPGVPTASAKLYRGKLARAVTFAANFAGAQFTASANATASTVFDIQKNGSSVGSCTIAAGGITPTFASSGGAAVAYAAGDVFAVIGPASPDATLADPAITFAGTR